MDVFREYGAKAIWLNGAETLNTYIKFQSEFFVTEKSVKLYICTETKYELYINGVLAGFGQYDDFPTEKVYDEIDISKFVIPGINLISILAYSLGENCSSHIHGTPLLIFAAVSKDECILRSDERIKCCDDTEFKSGMFEKITGQRSFNFGFDLRRDDHWRQKLVSRLWENAKICDDSHITYIPRPTRMTVISEPIFGKIITQGTFQINGGTTVAEKMQFAALSYHPDILKSDVLPACENVYWIQDLGSEIAGHIFLEIDAEKESELYIAIGEHLADLRVRSSVGGRNFAFSCNCRRGKQKICFNIKRIAGRYFEVFAFNGIKSVKAGLCPVEYPLEFDGEWKSSDRLFNRIYEVSKNTLRLCVHEHYEDCPEREQALYGMDSRNQMLCGYYAFGEIAMARSSILLLAKTQKADGLLQLCAPSEFSLTIPSFSLIWIIAVWEYMMFSGDVEFAASLQPTMRKVLDYFVSFTKDGLLMRPKEKNAWNFYEWTDDMDDIDTLNGNFTNNTVESDAPLNCFFILALSAYGKICKETATLSEYDWTNDCINKIKEVFHTKFYVPQVGAYKNYITNKPHSFSQLTQSLALLAGCVPAEYESTVREKLLSGKLTETSLSCLIFKYDALMQEPEKYGDAVLSDIENKWGFMLYNGATSFWETILGEADFDGAGSLCHGWSAVPIYIFWRYVMGIYPTSPGVLQKKENTVCGCNISAYGTLKLQDRIIRVEKKHDPILDSLR